MQVMFVYTDITDENLAKPFLTLFGLEDSENTVVIFQMTSNLLTTFGVLVKETILKL